MKATLLQEHLRAALKSVRPAIPGKPILPWMGCVLIEAQPGNLRLTCTDGMVTIRQALLAHVEGTGSVAVSARLLADFVEALPAAPIKLELKESKLQVKCGKTTCTLQNLAQDYADVREVTGSVLTLDGAVLSRAIASVIYAASTGSAYPVLQGCELASQAKALTIAATDGNRLATYSISVDVNGASKAFVVPARALAELKALSGTVTVTVSGTQAAFSTTDKTVIATLLNGQFPVYSGITSQKDFVCTAMVQVAELTRAVKQLAAFVEADEYMPVLLDVAATGISLKSSGNERGEGTVDVPVMAFTGKPTPLAFQARYLSEALDAAVGDTVTLKVVSPQAPVHLSDADDRHFQCIALVFRK